MPTLYDAIADHVMWTLHNAPLGTEEEDRIRVREAVATILRPRLSTILDTVADHSRPCILCGQPVWVFETKAHGLIDVSRDLAWHSQECSGGKTEAKGMALELAS